MTENGEAGNSWDGGKDEEAIPARCLAAGICDAGRGRALSGAAQPAGAVTRSSRSRTPQADSATSEPIVAYLGQGGRGEVRLLVGDREIVHHDPDLARRLRAAAAG
jgi:hypothetical protein